MMGSVIVEESQDMTVGHFGRCQVAPYLTQVRYVQNEAFDNPEARMMGRFSKQE